MVLLRATVSFLFVALHLLSIKAQDQQACTDASFCAIPQFSTYCTHPTFKEQFAVSCPRFCGTCVDPESANDVRCNSEDNGGCEHLCTIKDNAVKCECFAGFHLMPDGANCTDTNECLENPCTFTTKCINRVGSFFCSNQNCSNNPGFLNRYQSDDCCRNVPDAQCGRDLSSASARVVGGNSAVFGAWPWMVYILIDNRVLCGGTLISTSWVVTAGHCFRRANANSTITMYFGRLNPNRFEPQVQSREAVQLVLHEDWDKDRFPYHDIALLRLASPVQLSQGVDIACLPNGEKPEVGSQCWVTGYGTTASGGSAAEDLQEVDLIIQDMNRCKESYRDTSYPIRDNIMFCAGHTQGGKDSCQGDSGGPLVCQRCDTCQWYLAGVVSFGRGCARPNYYGVYTNVEYYEEWISRHTGIPVNKNKRCRGTSSSAEWSRWGEWSSCSRSCEGGTRTRSRNCMNGNVGGPGCQGLAEEPQTCNTEGCQDSSQWGQWTAWSECSRTCGEGERMRVRSCTGGTIGEGGCQGSNRELEGCNPQNCPVWGEYGSWSECSESCGGGTRTRSRSCIGGDPGEAGCDEGSDTKTMFCNEHGCPMWSNWGSWSSCSVTCGGGSMSAGRLCKTHGVVDALCVGNANRSRICNTKSCPTWNDYGSWGACTERCGGGTRSRSRTCEGGNPGDIGCHIGSVTETTECNTQACDSWTNWGSWGSCSASCGEGSKTRTRSCLNGSPGDPGCEGSEEDRQVCNTLSCLLSLSPWSSWTSCSATCGGGSRRQTRSCVNGEIGDEGCQGPTQIAETCNTQSCPKWSSYGAWSECSTTCGEGRQTSTRTCISGLPDGGGCEGSPERSGNCNPGPCPYWGNWTSIGECSRTCDQGEITQIRICVNGDVGQNGCVGNTTRTVSCQLAPCPSMWTDWSEYGDCSVSCGAGVQNRTRICVGGALPVCPGDAIEVRSCGETCSARWNNWGQWSDCSKTCSGGLRQRGRTCLDGVIGEPGCSPANMRSQQEICNQQSCPGCSDKEGSVCFTGYCSIYFAYVATNCQETCNLCTPHGPWGGWSDCSATCGGGFQQRSRFCTSFRGSCFGSPEEMRACNTNVTCSGYSLWGAWSSCTASCNGGTRRRTRACPPGVECQPDQFGSALVNEEECQTLHCPGRWSPWGNYTDCSKSCGGGLKMRRRSCIGGEVGETGCEGLDVEESSCFPNPCPGVWGNWTPVGNCSVSCGEGVQNERRDCNGGVVGGPGCEGVANRQVVCTQSPCVTQWMNWGNWGTCSSSCGGGERTRTRSCEHGVPGDAGCEGNSTETQTCNTSPCQGGGQCSSFFDMLSTCSSLTSTCSIPEHQAFLLANCRRTCCEATSGGGSSVACQDRPIPNGLTCIQVLLSQWCQADWARYFCSKTCGFCQ